MRPGTEVAPGVFRLGADVVSYYVIEAGDRLTLVDAGGPKHFRQLADFLAERQRSLADVDAVLLTHAHADHVGFAERARTAADATVLIHAADAVAAQGGDDGRTTEAALWRYLGRPAAYRTLATVAWTGAMNLAPVAEIGTFDDGETLDVPGRPRTLHIPGHTRGNAVLYFADRLVLCSGDALVTWNAMTGRAGPQIPPAVFNESSEQALESLDRLRGIEAAVLLPGHGLPWTGGVDVAVAMARRRGRS